MIAGHFGFAAAIKSREPETPLWALMLATVWLDVVFVPLYLSGIETAQPADKAQTGYGTLIIHADYTHSLVGMNALSAILGVLAGALGKTLRHCDRLGGCVALAAGAVRSPRRPAHFTRQYRRPSAAWSWVMGGIRWFPSASNLRWSCWARGSTGAQRTGWSRSSGEAGLQPI